MPMPFVFGGYPYSAQSSRRTAPRASLKLAGQSPQMSGSSAPEAIGLASYDHSTAFSRGPE